MIYYGESSRENGVNSISVEMSFGEEEGDFYGSTGIKTLDMLLLSFCKQGHIDLTVDVEETNEFTPETIAVLMGNCTRMALDGVTDELMAVCEVPFGESLGKAVLDISENALTAFVFECELDNSKSYIRDFLKTYTYSMGKTMHIYIYGSGGDQHKAEAIFRSLGKCFLECLK